jgi:hypothetical protein
LQCASNLRQVGLGLIGYLNAKNQFPNAGTFGESVLQPPDPTKPGTSIINTIYTPANFTIAAQANPTAGQPTDVGPLYSWVVDILPHVDNQELYNSNNRVRFWADQLGRAGDPPAATATSPSNLTVTNTNVGIFSCPEDTTVVKGTGNLSYVVNMGFARFQANPIGWNGTALGGSSAGTVWWADPGSVGWQVSFGFAKKTAVMFLGTYAGNAPWDAKTTGSSVQDGMSTTILASENILAGSAPAGSTYYGPLPVNWGTPHPNSMGFIASDNVCQGMPPSGNTCFQQTDLHPVAGNTDGPGWQRANQVGSFENINFGINLGETEGAFPYPCSYHSGGINVVCCDGSTHFISDTVDATVWSKLITPSGSKLPPPYRQLPVDSDALNSQ